MHVTIQKVTRRPLPFIENLMRIWESSVRATHIFLTNDDIDRLKPIVRQGIQSIPIIMVAQGDDGALYGFMGIEGSMVEMLFIAPEHRGKGIGRRFITYAVTNLHAYRVDVNEQNPQAIGFYQKMGFTVFKRSPTDGQGNPFPILHMQLQPHP